MSFRSYTTYDCTVPDTTELHSELKSYSVWDIVDCEHDDGLYKIHFEGETRWADSILDELKDLFRMPLDKVPGLELHCHYETDEYEHFEFTLDIVDGKCTYKESEIRMVEQPMNKCLIDLGYYKED